MTTPGNVAVPLAGGSHPGGMALPGAARLPGAGPRTVVWGTVGVALAVLLGTTNPVLAMIPPILVAVAYGVLRLPVRITAFAVLGLAVLSDITPSRLANEPDVWHSPVYPLQFFLTQNLNKLLGIEAAKISGVELILLGLVALAGLRALAGDRTDAVGRVPVPRPLLAMLLLSLFAVLALEAWGIARGGDVRQSIWQFRLLLALPILALLLCAAMRDARDAALFGGMITAVSCLKILIGGYFYLVVARAHGEVPATVTSHSDSVLFVVTMAGWLAAAYYRPTLLRLLWVAGLSGWTLFGLVINNRRTAYVTLAAEVAMFFVLLPRRTQRGLIRFMLYSLPVVAVYLAAGRNHTTGVFAPAGKIMSVVTQQDASSQTRDIENFNLIVTLRRNPVIGSGWGHEYVEVVRAYDISSVFAQYRYIAHNSVLWLWSIGGLVGFTLVWLPLAAGVFFAARAHAYAVIPLHRSVAYGALATYVAFAIQAWADMGTQSWTTQGLLAVALAASGKLAVRTGAWPQHTRLVGASLPRDGAPE